MIHKEKWREGHGLHKSMRLKDAVHHEQGNAKHHKKEAKEESDIFLELEPGAEKEVIATGKKKTKPTRRSRLFLAPTN